MASYLDVVRRCDSVPYPGEEGYDQVLKTCYRFIAHDGHVFLGWVLPIVADQLVEFNDIVTVDKSKRTITLSSSLKTCKERTDAMSKIVNKWRSESLFECLKGWRNELYTVYNPTSKVYLFIERASACLFGFTTYGVHIVGYVPATADQEMMVWVPTRSLNKPTHPGKYDNTVAGGIGYPHGVFETVLKECAEEAGLEEDFVKKNITPVGVVSYNFRMEPTTDDETGVFQPEVEYIYDLVMEGVTPSPVDGEVHEFRLVPASQLKQELFSDRFKYNCALIQIDFFIRHGLITQEEEPNYLEVLQRCHRRLDHPTM